MIPCGIVAGHAKFRKNRAKLCKTSSVHPARHGAGPGLLQDVFVMRKVENGDKVRDIVTGFSGICVGITQWLNGCRRVAIQPKIGDDGKLVEPLWFDEQQIEVVSAGAIKIDRQDTGGPLPSRPTRNKDP